jgi:hypothetical protein
MTLLHALDELAVMVASVLWQWLCMPNYTKYLGVSKCKRACLQSYAIINVLDQI